MRVLRFLIYTLLGLVVFLALVVLFLATPPGRSVFASLVERFASGNGLVVTVGRVSGWPPFSFGAGQIVLADKDGPFAELDGLVVDFAIGQLLGGTIGFNQLTAERVAISREPVLPSSGGGGVALAPLA